jgi:hypothetical protein
MQSPDPTCASSPRYTTMPDATFQLPTSLTSRRGRYSCGFDLCLSPIRSLEAEGLQTAQHRGTRP